MSVNIMKVLFIIRDDFETVTGGDGVQMVKTRAALENLGVKVDLRKSGETHSSQQFNYDIGHVFNIQTFESSWRAMQLLKRAKVPVALSTIYWDTFDHMADMAGQEHSLWSKIRSLVGRENFRKLYLGRMKAKHEKTLEYKTQKKLIDSADILLPNSKSEGLLLDDLFKVSYALKTISIVNAIDTSLYPPKEKSDYLKENFGIENPVLQIGRISSVKNQLRVIEALLGTKIPLVFIGQVEHEEYAASCRRLGEQRGNTYFINRIPHEELPGIYASARVHVLPSWRETPGLVSLEAAAAGCRIVTTSIGSTRDYFGDDAWYVFPDDVAGIRSAILEAYEAPRNDGLAARIIQDYTWKQAGEQTLAAYKTLLNQSSV